MTEAFLYKVAQHLHTTYGDGIDRLCLVLPNKRGALFLKQHLAKVYNKTIWLPHIVAAEEFITELAGIPTADSITLITELYKAYRDVLKEKAEPFESFVKWGNIMLHDFNEADRYLVNAKDMFGNLRDVKVIENWSLAEIELSDFQKNYVNFMYVMGDIYEVFTGQLLQQNLAYQGMSYRLAVENLQHSEFTHRYAQFVFCGFNALNKSEELIFSELVKENKADILWDIDNYYFGDKLQEAGKFLRKHLSNELLATKNFISNDLSEGAKNIEIIGVPKNMAQAVAASQKLGELIHAGARPDSMAVVLADESLLFPVLSALPEEIDAVNVTLEFPLRLTSIYDFVEQLLNLHINRSKSSSVQSAFYYKDLVKLFYNPYFNRLLNSTTRVHKVVQRIVEHNVSYFSHDTLQRYFEEQFEKIGFLFGNWNSINDALTSIETLCEKLKLVLLSSKRSSNELVLETEFLFEFSRILNRIRDMVGSVDFITGIRSFRILLQQLAATASVPFFGEPLKGLQVMGVLETRTLDFETVVLLSVNENILPSGKSSNSFIPFDLKKYFGLPVYADKDAVYAYHFYRILQRAKNIIIIYNTESDQFGNGEKSRFITQVTHELKEKNQNVSIKESVFSGQLQHTSHGNTVSIKKDKTILDKLLDKVMNPERSGLSPSSLNAFKDCSLRFYFQYGAEIKETAEVEENIEANTMGTILHEVLEKLYQPFTGKVMNSSLFKSLHDQV
ncbi:MAG: PD-(D/E)XK nuclease family protein, partial [Bacteroidia bacterium]